MVSAESGARNNETLLANQTVSNNIFVYVQPSSGVSRVRFYIDGVVSKTENNAPWDLGGTASNGDSLPYNTTQLADGLHTLTADITLQAGGSQQTSADFIVMNSGPQLISTPGNLSFVSIDGSDIITANIQISTSDNNVGISASLDSNVSWLNVNPSQTTTPGSITVTADPSQLADGTYNGQLAITSAGYATITVPVALQIGVQADQLHIGWIDDPSTSLAINWFTASTSTQSTVEYRPAGASAWQTATGSVQHQNSDGHYHQVAITGLAPATDYEFRVQVSLGLFSEIYTTHTAPAPGNNPFDFVYVADTGLIGREDGLATGTQQVIDEIETLNPSLILLGGDYAYFNTDKRYGSLERTIDAWFKQIYSVSKSIPMMPTYGNHEVGSSEGFDEWRRRFSTPSGWNQGRMYSFDIGDVHIINIWGWHHNEDIPEDGLDWLAADLQAASITGKQWIIPFFHAALFSEGTNHVSALALRNQLGPLFEQWGVKLVLTAHDQSFERTYPLINVPATNTPTSTAKSCYTINDGITYLKSSPGGKLSNISKNFSPWANPVPSPWVAVRNNLHHHYTHIQINTENDLIASTYGVDGAGSQPVLIDRFRYTTGSCPPEITASPSTLNFQLGENETQTQTVSVTEGINSIPLSVHNTASWITVSPISGNTPETISVTANSVGLAPGLYQALIEISGESANTVTIPVSLSVNNNYALVFSINPQRNFSLPLDGANVQDEIYVYTSPDINVKQVLFYIDDLSGTGVVFKQEKNAPYDLGGTNSDGTAKPFETVDLNDGQHSVTARLELLDGSQALTTGLFNVNNFGPSLLSDKSSLNFQIQQPATTASDALTLSYSDGSVIPVTLSSNAVWLNLSQNQITTPSLVNIIVDSSGLSPGQYAARIDATSENGQVVSVNVTLSVTAPFVPAIVAPASTSITVSEDAPNTSSGISVSTNDGMTPTISVDYTASWISTPSSIVSPTTLTLVVDASELEPGNYQDTITLSSPGYSNQSIQVLLEVQPQRTNDYSLLVSNNPDRSQPAPLQGSLLSSPVYIFTSPDNNGITSVEFYVDSLSGPLLRRDRKAPYDLGGGSVSTAKSWNPSSIGVGLHTLFARIVLNNSTVEIISADFTVN